MIKGDDPHNTQYMRIIKRQNLNLPASQILAYELPDNIDVRGFSVLGIINFLRFKLFLDFFKRT